MKFFSRLRRHNPGASLGRILFWDGLARPLSWLICFVLWRHRSWGAANIPADGSLLVICNHQSFVDPVVLGSGMAKRHFHAMARSTLFNNRYFGWLIRLVNTFAVVQGKGDIKAVRRAIELLRAGHAVLVFPEGGRTRNGVLGPFNAGLLVLIRRARPTVLPVAVDGGYAIWPIHRKWPRLAGRVGVQYGKPIQAESLLALPPDQAIARLRSEIETLRMDLRAKLRRNSQGRYPAHDAGDRSAV